jgi:hypothetical protein
MVSSQLRCSGSDRMVTFMALGATTMHENFLLIVL